MPVVLAAACFLLTDATARGQAPEDGGSTTRPAEDAPAESVVPLPDLVSVEDGLADAVRAAHKEASQQPNDPEKVGRLGLLSMRISSYGTAIECLERAARFAPKEMKWWYYMGLAHEESYERAKAREAYRTGLELDPNYAPMLTRLANVILEKDVKEAESLYQRALAQSPRDARIHFGLGECARLQNRPDEALAHFHKALQFAPRFAKAHSALARLYEAKGDKGNAGVHSESAKRGREPPVVKDPLYVNMMSLYAGPEWLSDIASQLVNAGNPEAAMKYIEQLERHPKYRDEVQRLLGRVYLLNQDMEKAATHLGAYVREGGSDVEHRNLYIQALMELKRFNEAAKELSIIINDQPDDLAAYTKAGLVALIINDPAAGPLLLKAVELNPKNADARAGRVVYFLNSRKYDAASNAYRGGQMAFESPAAMDAAVVMRAFRVSGARPDRKAVAETESSLVEFAKTLSQGDFADSAARFEKPWETVSRFVDKAVQRGDFQGAFDAIQECIEADRGGIIRDALSRTLQAMKRASRESATAFVDANAKIGEKDPTVAKLIAWVKSTAADAELRDASGAIRLAESAAKATANNDPEILDTLAAACAESGDFDRAARVMKEAIEKAAGSKTAEQERRFQDRLKLYQDRKAYRQ